ncbi:MAG: hypothetical protein QW568_03505 [Candidatus Anstonellaceae archaeon]
MKSVIAALVILALLFGCAGTPANVQVANKTYACPDGSNVTNSSLCKKAEVAKYVCPDGTAVSDAKLCKENEPEKPALSPEQQQRAEQIAKVKNASAAIDLDRQLLLRGKFLYNAETVEGCRNYFSYYQGIAKRFQSDYGAYLDEFAKLAEMYAENGTCASAVSSGRQAVGAAWDYGRNSAGKMMALCTEDEFHREFYFYYQTNTSWENASALVGTALDELDSSLSTDCARAYRAQKETVN